MVYQLQHVCWQTTHTHTRLTALFPGLPVWAGTRKVKPIWISMKQETVSDIGISWTICKQSAPHSRQITTPAAHHSVVFTGRMPFLPPIQQSQSIHLVQNPAGQQMQIKQATVTCGARRPRGILLRFEGEGK